MRHICLHILPLLLITSYGENKIYNSSEIKESSKTMHIPDAENYSNSDLNISTPIQPQSSIFGPLKNLISNLLKLPGNKSKENSSSTSPGNASTTTESQWNFLGKPLSIGSRNKDLAFFRIIRQVKDISKTCNQSSGKCGVVDQTKSYMKDYLNVTEAQYLTLFGFIALGLCMGLLLAKFLGDEDE